MDGTKGNGRYDAFLVYEVMVRQAGVTLGRAMNYQQVSGARLVLEVFGYLLGHCPENTLTPARVIFLLNEYLKGVSNAKSQS